ncbi:MAG TPA: hypothetical protein VHF05_03205 [Candidatus Paceibacterota bacterium]|jgi:hypothetical protein|nr:hypothetical protein [Candidatus Paceibacterota bacterium]
MSLLLAIADVLARTGIRSFHLDKNKVEIVTLDRSYKPAELLSNGHFSADTRPATPEELDIFALKYHVDKNSPAIMTVAQINGAEKSSVSVFRADERGVYRWDGLYTLWPGTHILVVKEARST